MNFWDRLRGELEYNCITHKELASKINIQKSTLEQRFLRQNSPDAEFVYQCSKLLNVSMEWLLTGENPTTNLPLDIQKVAHELLTVEGKKRDSIISLIHNQVEFWKNN